MVLMSWKLLRLMNWSPGDQSSARPLVQCNGNGEIDARVFPQRSMEDNMIKYVIPIAILFGTTASAFAADYYIVRGSDKRCTIVETRPTDKTVVVIGDKAYVSREEATRQMAIVCKK
jgi:hypothetical protein